MISKMRKIFINFIFIFFSVRPSNFVVLCFKSSRYPALILNVITFSILFMFILIEGIFEDIFKTIFNIGYRIRPGKFNFSFHAGTDILNLFLLYDFLVFFHV